MEARSVLSAEFRAVWICTQVCPPSIESQTPPLPALPLGIADPYMILLVVPFQSGSSFTWFTPRMVALALVPLQVAGQPSPPSQLKVKVVPPSVDSNKP